MEIPVGRIIRSNTTRFAVGCRVLRPEVPAFGCLVKVAGLDDHEIYGLIYDVRMEDDPFVRQVAALQSERPEVREDQRLNRQVPIEVAVLTAGYRHGPTVYHHLPPQPPLSLDWLHTAAREELIAFSGGFDYFPLILDNRDLPADELLAAHLRYAAEARGTAGTDFLVDAGRELARLLAVDLPRLDAILRRIRP